MLTLYHTPISPNSRRVWVTLLEKGLEFELVELKLSDGEQFQPDYLAINPFHHIPALVDDGFNVVESLAILDYLEAKYPTPTMLPQDVKDLTIVRMVQMVSVNELLPSIDALVPRIFDLPGEDLEKVEKAQQKIATALTFFEKLLGDRSYFGSDNLTLADVVAGTIVPLFLVRGGISLVEYPKVSAWCDRLMARPTWQASEATPEAFENFRSILVARMQQN
ncbi:MAG: glutathione S-transferase family protein [Okeania sp. SIO2C2]|uniref:glutathione S-transferase family protein n=1 Tax=Okeania sp. SIO2C2 TaxID=2607787 RepID=UPI0013B85048|nr:glutathione S-transferase family protein [Okeania sp. SIO2C2]NEP85562.1 glutathione S-transferase family protein [Okeania sp. SIO2C2]